MFNHRCKDMDLYNFVGIMMGIAIRCDIPLELRWPTLVWKRIVGQEITREDLAAVDEALFHVIQNVTDAPDEAAFTSEFSDLCFSVHTHDGEEMVELVDKGCETPVTFDRRMEWVEKVIAFKKEEGMTQIDAMMQGLASIIPAPELCVFSPRQFEVLVCGEPHVNIDVLRSNVVYDGCKEDEPQVQWMWEVLDEMSQEDRALFLQFVWSRTRLPVSASQMTMKFKVQSAPDSVNADPDSHLPLAHTCFFSISIPKYSSKTALKSKLLYAIKHCRAMDSDFRLHTSDLVMTRSN